VREMLQSAAGWREEDIREQAVAKLADLCRASRTPS
jgi:hypothetical protein